MLFERLNLAFSAVFLIEIGVNLFANWFRRFFRDTWNIVDAVCVLLSLAAIGQSNWTALRFMRTVRVVRLFGKFKEMRRMLRSLAACVPQMGCAFFILMVLASICESPTPCIAPLSFIPLAVPIALHLIPSLARAPRPTLLASNIRLTPASPHSLLPSPRCCDGGVGLRDAGAGGVWGLRPRLRHHVPHPRRRHLGPREHRLP